MIFRMVWKSGQIFLLFCHESRVWQTDKQADRRTDGRTEFWSLDHVCIPCSAVKTIAFDRLEERDRPITSPLWIRPCLSSAIIYMLVLDCSARFIGSQAVATLRSSYLSLCITLCHRTNEASIDIRQQFKFAESHFRCRLVLAVKSYWLFTLRQYYLLTGKYVLKLIAHPWYAFSVVAVCLSVSQTINFESLIDGVSTYLHIWCISWEYGSSSYMKAIGQCRGHRSTKVQNPSSCNAKLFYRQ